MLSEQASYMLRLLFRTLRSNLLQKLAGDLLEERSACSKVHFLRPKSTVGQILHQSWIEIQNFAGKRTNNISFGNSAVCSPRLLVPKSSIFLETTLNNDIRIVVPSFFASHIPELWADDNRNSAHPINDGPR